MYIAFSLLSLFFVLTFQGYASQTSQQQQASSNSSFSSSSKSASNSSSMGQQAQQKPNAQNTFKSGVGPSPQLQKPGAPPPPPQTQGKTPDQQKSFDQTKQVLAQALLSMGSTDPNVRGAKSEEELRKLFCEKQLGSQGGATPTPQQAKQEAAQELQKKIANCVAEKKQKLGVTKKFHESIVKPEKKVDDCIEKIGQESMLCRVRQEINKLVSSVREKVQRKNNYTELKMNGQSAFGRLYEGIKMVYKQVEQPKKTDIFDDPNDEIDINPIGGILNAKTEVPPPEKPVDDPCKECYEKLNNKANGVIPEATINDPCEETCEYKRLPDKLKDFSKLIHMEKAVHLPGEVPPSAEGTPTPAAGAAGLKKKK